MILYIQKKKLCCFPSSVLLLLAAAILNNIYHTPPRFHAVKRLHHEFRERRINIFQVFSIMTRLWFELTNSCKRSIFTTLTVNSKHVGFCVYQKFSVQAWKKVRGHALTFFSVDLKMR